MMARQGTYGCRPAAVRRPSLRAGFAERLDPARRSQARPGAAVVAAWRGAEGRSTWPTWQQARPGAGRAGQLPCGGDVSRWRRRVGDGRGSRSTRLRLAVFDEQRGRDIAGGTTTRSHARAEGKAKSGVWQRQQQEMKRVMDRRQRACQIWGNSRGEKWIVDRVVRGKERGPAVAGGGGCDVWSRIRRWQWQLRGGWSRAAAGRERVAASAGCVLGARVRRGR
jgi:hypothetical protein